MAQSQEQIEARLCDYVEGTLTPAERTDIEKHLALNPGHRKLIDELMKTKNLIRQLPRVKAPADVSETLQGQLERSVLLGAMSDDMPESTMRIGFGSRMRAIAAVLILSLGLGSIVFFMLRDTRSLPELAKLPPRPEETFAANDEPVPAESATLSDTVASARRADAESSSRPEPSRVAAAAATPAAPIGPAGADGGIASNAFAADAPAPGAIPNDTMFGAALAERMKVAAGANSFRYVVANVPTKEVEGYLERNQIAWTVEPMPEPLTLREDQSVLGSMRNQRSSHLEPRQIEPLARDRARGGSEVFGAATKPSDNDKAVADASELDAKADTESRAGGEPASMPVALATNVQSKLQTLIVARQLTPKQLLDLELTCARPSQVVAKAAAPQKQLALDEMKLKDDIAPTTQPATGPLNMLSAFLPGAIEPSGAARVDVFIVVDNPPTAPATAPSTQPTTQPNP